MSNLEADSEAIRFDCSALVWHGDLVTGLIFAHWLAIFTILSAVLGAIGRLISSILKVKQLRTTGDILEKSPAAFYCLLLLESSP